MLVGAAVWENVLVAGVLGLILGAIGVGYGLARKFVSADAVKRVSRTLVIVGTASLALCLLSYNLSWPDWLTAWSVIATMLSYIGWVLLSWARMRHGEL